MKLTDWYPGHIKPLPDRVGVYERKMEIDSPVVFYNWWNGQVFLEGSLYIASCAKNSASDLPSSLQSLPWRGVAEPPKERK